jgi:hypothetical protein
MKKLIFIICLFLISYSAESRNLMVVVGEAIVVAGDCSTPVSGSVFNEGFEGPGYENAGWTETGSPDEDANCPSGGPTGSCTSCLRATATTAADYHFIIRNPDIGATTAYYRFWFYLNSESLSDTDLANIFYVGESSSEYSQAPLIRCYVKQEEGVLNVYASSSGGSYLLGPITTGTWHYITINAAVNSAAASAQLDAESAMTMTTENNYNDYVFLGALGLVEKAFDIYFDRFQIDADGSWE